MKLNLTIMQIKELMDLFKEDVFTVQDLGIDNSIKISKFVKEISAIYMREFNAYQEVRNKSIEELTNKYKEKAPIIIEFFTSISHDVAKANEILNRDTVSAIRDELMKLYTELNTQASIIDKQIYSIDIDFDFKDIIPCDVSLKFFVRFDFLFNNEEIKNEEEKPESKKKPKEEKKS